MHGLWLGLSLIQNAPSNSSRGEEIIVTSVPYINSRWSCFRQKLSPVGRGGAVGTMKCFINAYSSYHSSIHHLVFRVCGVRAKIAVCFIHAAGFAFFFLFSC